MPDVRYVVVPLLYRNISPRQAIEQTEAVFDDLVQELTTNPTDRSANAGQVRPSEVERFEGGDRFDAFQEMNQEYLDRDWGDGFPLMPATSHAVDQMLKGTSLSPNHVLCDLAPSHGLATVEKIAVNAALAGAQPEHMPVIIAALKAVSEIDPPGHAQSLLTSTSAHASMLLVNGPIANELDINSKMCMGPGRQNKANLAIGRAYTLCLKNIGHWYPNVTDMDTIGSHRKFSPCLAENEDTSPWEPFHVEKGFNKEDSVVTLIGTKGEIDVYEGGHSTGEGALKTVAYNCLFGQSDMHILDYHGNQESPWETVVLVPPDLARVVAEDGFSKQAAKEFIHEHAKMGLGKLIHHHLKKEIISPQWQWVLELSEQERDEIVKPVRESAERYQLICVGADRNKPMIIPSAYPSRPVSVNADQYRPSFAP